MAFNPDEYLQKNNPMKGGGGFDPDAYLAAQKTEEVSSRPGQTALESFGNAATLGYLPHLQAGVGKLMGLGDYVQLRDENIKRQKELSAENPKASIAGTVGGSISSALIPGGAAAKATTGLGRVLQAGKAGAVIGALANPGDTEGEISPIQLEDRAKGAAIGAGTGAATAGVLEGIKAGAKALSPILSGKAEDKAFKSTGAILKDFRNAGRKDEIRPIGRTLLDEGLVGAGSTPDKIARDISTSIDKSTDEVNSLIKNYSDKLTPEFVESLSPEKKVELAQALFKPTRAAKQLKEEFIKKYGEENIAALAPALSEFESVANQGNKTIGLLETNEQKRRLNNLIKDASYSRTEPGIKEAAQLAKQGKLRRAVENVSDVIASASGESPGAVKEANRNLGRLIEVEKIAKDRTLRNEANRLFSPSDYAVGLGGAVLGAGSGDSVEDKAKNAALGLTAGLLHKNLRNYGPGIQAAAYDAAAKGAAKLGESVGKLDGSAVARAMSNLVNKGRNGFKADDAITPEALQILSKNPDLINEIEDPKLRLIIRKKLGRSPGSK